MQPRSAERAPSGGAAGWPARRGAGRRLVIRSGLALFIATLIPAKAISLGLEPSPAATRL